jgi:hypothetical protein
LRFCSWPARSRPGPSTTSCRALSSKLQSLHLDAPNPPWGEDDPPAVTIYDINMVEIDSKTVDAGESFTLIGAAQGNIPFGFFWLLSVDGNTVVINETSYLIDFILDEPGDYIITLEVIDVNGLKGSDSVAITVLPNDPVPVEKATWGAIKVMYAQ